MVEGWGGVEESVKMVERENTMVKLKSHITVSDKQNLDHVFFALHDLSHIIWTM